MNIDIYSKEEIEKSLNEGKLAEGRLIISFYGRHEEPVGFEDYAGKVIHVCCEDIEADDLEFFSLTEETFFPEVKNVAHAVLDAVKNGRDIICQCEHGQSRSAGLAAAIRQFVNGDGTNVFADDRYYPNKLIYRKMISELEKEEMMGKNKIWPEVAGGDEKLKDICYRKAFEIFGDRLPAEVSSRIDWEFEAIKKQKMAFIFLYLREIMDQCNLTAEDVRIGGTGANSMIAYLCGISYFNPMDFGLSPYFAFGYNMYELMPSMDLYVPESFQKKMMEAAGNIKGLDGILRASCWQKNEKGEEELVPHPGGIYYIPNGTNLSDITDTFFYNGEECAKKTWSELLLYKQNILASDDLQKLYDMKRNGKYNGKFSISRLNGEQISLYRDVPYFDCMVKLEALKHFGNMSTSARTTDNDKESFERIMATREDVYEYLLKIGMDEEKAYRFTEKIRKGERNELGLAADCWFIDFFCRCRYLPSRGHVIAFLREQLSVRYPELVTE